MNAPRELCLTEQKVEHFTIDQQENVLLQQEFYLLQGDSPLGLMRMSQPEKPSKAVVMLVHGFAQNRFSWHCSKRSMQAYLAAQGYDVWNLELRGHGLGRAAGGKSAGCFHDYVEDVIDIAKALPEPAFWIGHSLGGATLYGAASTMQPLRCRGVIGIGAIFHFGKGNWLMKTLGHLTHRLAQQDALQLLQVKTKYSGHLLARLYGITDILGYTFPLSGWWPGTVEPDLLEERLKYGFDWTSVKVWQEMSRWIVQGYFDYEGSWQQKDFPLLVLIGDKDHLLPPVDGRAAYDLFHGADKKLIILDDFHHDTHWGHLDLILGKYAQKHVWKTIAEWMSKRL